MTKARRWRYGLTAMLFLTLSGCMVGPTYQAPDASRYMAEDWNAASLNDGQQLEAQKAPVTAWRRQFRDPTLSGLVEGLVDSSPALAEFRQRIVKAPARQGGADADLLVARQRAPAEVVRLYRSLEGGWQVMTSEKSQRERTVG